MPTTATRLFGALEYEESWVVSFPFGLPGFEQETRFVLLERPVWSPIVFLQSLHRPALCFLAAPVAVLDPNYCLRVTRETSNGWAWMRSRSPSQEYRCYAWHYCARQKMVR